jgi:hypothetical protein
VTPGPADYTATDRISSLVHRATLGHVNPQHAKFESEITPGPCDYENRVTTSKVGRTTLGHVNPEHARFDQEVTPGPCDYTALDRA